MSEASRLTRFALPALLVVAGALLLANLGSPMLWQDEAETALYTRSVLIHGKPIATDGRNFFTQEQGAECGPGFVQIWHPWLPYYVLGGFFALLGESTFVARLPFALLGVATVWAAWALAGDIWRSRRAGFLAGLLLTFDVPFLVLSRQCRYYSVGAFLVTAGLIAAGRVHKGSRAALTVFVAVAILLFHTHYVYFAALLAAALADAAFHGAVSFRRTLAASGVAVAAAVPWFLWTGRPPYGARYGVLHPEAFLPMGASFLSQLASYVVPWPFLLLGVVMGALAWRAGCLAGGLVAARPLMFFSISCLVALSATAYGDFFRNLAPLVPIAAVLMAGVTEFAWGRHRALGAAAVAAALSVQPLSQYRFEITHGFVGPLEGIVGYLRANANPGDTVAATYEDLPLKFYTKHRVIGALTGEDLAPATRADWIVIRRYAVAEADMRMTRLLETYVDWRRYEKIVLDAPDTAFENRESPQEHRFRTATNEPPVVIFRRRAVGGR